MGRFVGIGIGVVGVLALTAALVTLQLHDAADESPAAEPSYSTSEVLRTLASPGCPQVLRDAAKGTRYRPVADSDPPLDSELSSQFTRRKYCLTSFFWEQPRGWRLTSYTVAIRRDAANHGQSFTTSDPQGDDELLSFPFLTTVHGPCAKATGEVVMTDRRGGEHRYTATLRIGPRCSGTR